MSLPARLPRPQAQGRGIGLWHILECLAALIIACFAAAANSAGLPLKDQPHLRRPVAAAWIEKDKLLAVANRCGSISIVDYPAREAIQEVLVGERLADIARHPSGRLLAVDEKRHELVLLERSGSSLRVSARHQVSSHPVSVCSSATGKWIAVASLWSRKITVFETDERKTGRLFLREVGSARIAFNPGKVIPNNGDWDGFYVHDAFASRAVAVNAFPTYIVESSSAANWELTTEWRASYGGSWDFEAVAAEEMKRRFKLPVKDERTLAGGMEFYKHSDVFLRLGPVSVLTLADRGERFFYRTTSEWRADLIPRLDSTSCHTCHVNGHTTYQLADTLGDDTTGTPKRIPTLLGTRLTDPWAWSGKMRDLNEQVRKSLETTMHVKDFTEQQVADITAYLHTLPPPPPLEPATADPADRAKLESGKSLFGKLGCAQCHVPPLTYTSSDAYDVGLSDEKGMTKFNPPSLRGVSQGYSFLHDGRAKKLEEVFTVHGHGIDRALTDQELVDLLRFLRSL